MRTNWKEHAACKGMDTVIFFPTRDLPKLNTAKVNAAKAICSACTVRNDCLEYSRTLPWQQGREGIWGGMTEQERHPRRRHPKDRSHTYAAAKDYEDGR
jgi:WhiB family redox-sensing transcriptional regulator